MRQRSWVKQTNWARWKSGSVPISCSWTGVPLQDVANTSRYAGVMVRGRWLDGDALRRALTD
jgi:hypothetical protein